MAAMRSSRQFSAASEIRASICTWCCFTPAIRPSVNSQSLRSPSSRRWMNRRTSGRGTLAFCSTW